MWLFEVNRDRVAARLPDVISGWRRGVAGSGRVQAVRTRCLWFAGLRKKYAFLASSLAMRFSDSLLAFVTPVSVAAISSSSQRAIVLARLASSGMSSCWAHQSQKVNSRSRMARSQGAEPVTRARRLITSRSISLAIHAARIS